MITNVAKTNTCNGDEMEWSGMYDNCVTLDIK